jgi:hypothetical protein
MSLRTTAVLFVVLLAVAGAVLIFQPGTDGEALATATAAPFVEALELYEGAAVEDVVRLEIVQTASADEVLFERDGEGAWTQAVPTTTLVFSPTLTNQVAGLLNSSARRSFPAEGGNLEPYGLEEPAYTIVVAVEREGSIVRYELALGSRTPTGDAYYTLKTGDPRVHLLSTAALEGLLRLLEYVPLPEATAP